MNMIGHDDPCMRLVLPDLGSVIDGSHDQLGNVRLSEKSRPATRLIEQPVHGDERFAGDHILGRKRAIGRKTAVQAEGNEQRLADYIQVREPTFTEGHISVVRGAREDS